jgi:RNA polymerase sigma-70 factor (ECF subfamily)
MQAPAVTANFVLTEQTLAIAQPEDNLLATVVLDHARLVYRIAYSVLRNASEAEDAVQETFLRVLRHGKTIGGKKIEKVRDPKAWLAQITWRVAVERRKRGTKDSARTQGAPPQESLPSGAPGVDRTLLEKERTEALQRFIAALPNALRDPLVLATLEELSPREVGAMLGISEAAVRSRSFRARQILKGQMLAWMAVKQ